MSDGRIIELEQEIKSYVQLVTYVYPQRRQARLR